jgi:DNA-binding IclR family transcriptional regulator
MTIEGRGVQSIEVGGRILKVMVEAGQPMMLRDLANRAELTAAQAHAYLLSFRKLELVEQDPATGRYQLGPFALQLGIARLRGFDPLRMASAQVIDLAAELGLMVTITVWGTHGPTVIHVQEGAEQIHVNVRPGTVYSLTGTATGTVFAAFMPPKMIELRVKDELEAGARTQSVGKPTSLEQLARDVAQVRRLGYASIEGRPVPGVNALAAPVFDRNGQMQLAVTLIGPAGIVATDPGSTHAEALLAFTHKLSAQLGYTPEMPEPSEPASALIAAEPIALTTRRRRRA